MRKRQNPTQTHLTICSDTGRWNLEGKSSLGFTVKHWISEFRELRSEKGISVTQSKQLNRNTQTKKDKNPKFVRYTRQGTSATGWP